MTEHVKEWVAAAWPHELRSMRSAVATEISVPPPAPGPDEVDRANAPMRWLLERCAEGVTLTQSGYLPPVLVADVVDRFDWWPFGGTPRSEVDVHQLEILRTTARRLRLTIRRGRRLTTSRRGQALLDDPIELWHTVAQGVGSTSAYELAVSEVVALRLVIGRAEEDDLRATVSSVIRAQDWRSGRSGGRALDDNEIRWSIHEPVYYWRLFDLLDEAHATWADDHHQLTPWTFGFTPAGRLAALSFLHAQATEGSQA